MLRGALGESRVQPKGRRRKPINLVIRCAPGVYAPEHSSPRIYSRVSTLNNGESESKYIAKRSILLISCGLPEVRTPCAPPRAPLYPDRILARIRLRSLYIVLAPAGAVRRTPLCCAYCGRHAKKRLSNLSCLCYAALRRTAPRSSRTHCLRAACSRPTWALPSRATVYRPARRQAAAPSDPRRVAVTQQRRALVRL